jgi:8-oxo-dGTP diphosphatase
VSLPRRLRGFAYKTFYRLPKPARRRIARMVAPKYLVGAVCIIRDSETDRLLFLRQAAHRRWSLPAGLLKKNEPSAVGAARELFEETGVRIDPDTLTAGNPNAIVHPVGAVDCIWFGEVPASTTKLRVDGGEILEAAWYAVDDLPDLTRNTALLLAHFGIGPRAAEKKADKKAEKKK